MKKGILITQCLQNDFVEPIGKYDSLPNLLHVGYSEAKRLMGENPDEGPVNTVIEWAYKIPEQDLEIIHIRDWHNPAEISHKTHLEQFGSHCIQNTPGAQFVFEEHILESRKHHIINASGLNDFIDTPLLEILNRYRGQKVNVGLMGVWTEAKVFFLSYEIATRYPEFELGICGALTASSSRNSHFIGLNQIQSILGAKLFPSVGSFTGFIAGSMPEIESKIIGRIDSVKLVLDPVDYKLQDSDRKIIYYLFKDCKVVELKCLDGGFSGNVVLKAKSTDLMGRKQVPTVIKIGQRDEIAKERAAFEQIQEVMGNSAPNIVDFAEIGNRGGIKYRYASMLEGNVKTFQNIYESGADLKLIDHFLEIVFQKQLGRLYDVEELEKLNLLKYYDFQSKYAPSVRKNVESLLGKKAEGETIEIISGIHVPNVCNFYEQEISHLNEYYIKNHYMAYIHGDLNGKNIIIDAQNNVWLIDFFHTRRGHVLCDLIKMENDLLYIFTKIENEEELREAMKLSDLLINVPDLGLLLDEKNSQSFKSPKLQRAYLAIRKLRSFYIPMIELDRDPYQLHVALLRYAMHTLSFEESSLLQKKWALYAGALCSRLIKENIKKTQKLRIDFLNLDHKVKIGITILPGRKDRNRLISEDIANIKEEGITHVLCLISEQEFHDYGVEDLKEAYSKAGLTVNYFPILDQSIPEKTMTLPVLDWMEKALNQKGILVIHCAGGLGRSGMMAALYLKHKMGFDAKEAIRIVREARTQRAIETRAQEKFIKEF